MRADFAFAEGIGTLAASCGGGIPRLSGAVARVHVGGTEGL